MLKSIIQLNGYYFTKTKILLNDRYKAEDIIEDIQIDAKFIDCNIMSFTKEDEKNPSEFIVRLELTIVPNENEEILPYNITLEAIGSFTITDKKMDAKKREQTAVLNGATILYSSMREYIHYLTSRYPHGPLQLPLVDFRCFSKSTTKKNVNKKTKSKPRCKKQ